MPQKTSTRLHPIAALRAVRGLTRDFEDTRQVFLLMDAVRGKTTLRQFARFRQTETGRAVLAERRQLLDWLSDRESLAALPAGTLGRSYYEFMAAENLSAEGLVEVSGLRETLPPGDDITLFRERSREMHDLLHVVTGYGRDGLGEVCLTAFSFAQTGLKGWSPPIGRTCWPNRSRRSVRVLASSRRPAIRKRWRQSAPSERRIRDR